MIDVATAFLPAGAGRFAAAAAAEDLFDAPDGFAPPATARVFAVTSGKGGVGKTNTVVNLAAALARQRKKVLVMDADLGLANLDLLLGVKPKYTLADFFSGKKRLADIILQTPSGISLLPAASGIQEATALTDAPKIAFVTKPAPLTHDVAPRLVERRRGL